MKEMKSAARFKGQLIDRSGGRAGIGALVRPIILRRSRHNSTTIDV